MYQKILNSVQNKFKKISGNLTVLTVLSAAIYSIYSFYNLRDDVADIKQATASYNDRFKAVHERMEKLKEHDHTIDIKLTEIASSISSMEKQFDLLKRVLVLNDVDGVKVVISDLPSLKLFKEMFLSDPRLKITGQTEKLTTALQNEKVEGPITVYVK